MAGDWIKVKTDLATDPAVIGIADTLGVDEDLVVGKLCRLWSWANSHTEDGHAAGVTQKWLDRHLGLDGLAAALCLVGWLEATPDGVCIPKFDRHNGKSAKTRANARERKRRERGVSRSHRDNGHAPSVTKTGHKTEREEKRREETPPLPPPADSATHAENPPYPVAWEGVEADLIGAGVFAPGAAISAAKLSGAGPEHVRDVLDYAASMPGAYGPGAIRNRVMLCRPGLDHREGWPGPSPAYEAQRQAIQEGKQLKAKREADAAELQRVEEQRLADAEIEKRLGPVLDGMSDEEQFAVARRCLGESPVFDRYQREGAVGLPRMLMLAELDRYTTAGDAT